MTLDQQIVLATIYGEAAQSSPAAWRAIASVIMNRVGKREWAHLHSPRWVVEHSGFDAYAQKNQPFREAMGAFTGAGRGGHTRLLALEDATRAILEGLEPPVTTAVLYFSPKAQAALHKTNPKRYRLTPPWDWGRIEEVQPPDLLPSDDFRFFKYRSARA